MNANYFLSDTRHRFAAEQGKHHIYAHSFRNGPRGFVVSDVDTTNRARLVVVEGEINLLEWSSKNRRKIWSSTHKQWGSNYIQNGLAFLNLNRLEEEVAIVLQAVIIAVLAYHERYSSAHRCLHNPENFLLRKIPPRPGQVGVEYECRLIGGLQRGSCYYDMQQFLTAVINKVFFERSRPMIPIPSELQHLQTLLNDYEGANWDRDNNRLLEDHISLWPSCRKVAYWNNFFEEFKSVKFGGYDEKLFRGIMEKSNKLKDGKTAKKDWRSQIPQYGYPLSSVLQYPTTVSIGRPYDSGATESFRFIRNTFVHILELTHGVRIHIPANQPNYENLAFVEAALSTLFFDRLIIV